MLSAITRDIQQGKLKEAEAACRKLISKKPRNAEAHHLLGIIQHSSGHLAEAESEYRKALALRPGFPETNCNLGALLHAAGRLEDAVSCYREALDANQDNYQVEYNLAHALMALEKHAVAEKHFRHVLTKQPGNHEAHFNLGLALSAQGNRVEALQCYRQTIQLKPDHADALNNMGATLMAQGHYPEAIEAFRHALAISPGNPKSHFNLGTAFKDSGQFNEAINSFTAALKLEPLFAKAAAELSRCRQMICDWRRDDYSTDKIVELTIACLDKGEDSPVYPFDALSLPFSPETQRRIATSHARIIRHNAGQVDEREFRYRSGGERLRIGYLSQKFNNHAGAHLIASLFGEHNREKFEIFAYSTGADDGSNYRQRIMADCDHFIDISTASDSDAAKRIFEDGINILVDLGVYNTFARTEIFALRPAPVQVSFLGYPGTSGSDFYDYIITDKVVTPPGQQPWYSEKFAYLPHCYQVNDHLLNITGNTLTRHDCGLPDNAFVFCSFNNSYKFEPEIFDIWMSILTRAPNSVLWLLDHSPVTSSNLRSEATQRGVSGDRLIFAEKQPKEQHLARHKHADLFLDTLYYNAHTTASDSLRMGVPLITLPGDTFASRVAASLLEAVSLPELIVSSKQAYEDLAIKFFIDREFHNNINKLLASDLETTPLFDTPQFARHLEGIYDSMWSSQVTSMDNQPGSSGP